VRLSVNIGNKAVVATGLFLVGVSFAWVSTASAATPYLEIVGQAAYYARFRLRRRIAVPPSGHTALAVEVQASPSATTRRTRTHLRERHQGEGRSWWSCSHLGPRLWRGGRRLAPRLPTVTTPPPSRRSTRPLRQETPRIELRGIKGGAYRAR
jgi:hypothetical protein